MRTRTCFVLAVLSLLLAGCVQLDGQRITFRYLAEQDELQILLCYDGIHSSDQEEISKARKQLTGFMQGGDFMLLDWPFHFDMGKFRENLAKEGEYTKEERRMVEALTSSVETTILGHYRDFDGRIGAAQLVVVKKASELLEAVNAWLSAKIIAGDVDQEWKRTAARMLEGAKRGEQWLRFDGHSIVMSAPVHLPEWQRFKGEQYVKLLRDVRNRDGDDSESGLIQLLAMAPLALIETPDRMTLRIGTKERPTTFRFRLRDTEKTGLDDAVLKLVPQSLDDRIAAALQGDGAEAVDPALKALLTWGPPEEQVRALLPAARGQDEERARAARAKLSEFAVRWNREVGFPEAPTTEIEGWPEWYRRVIRFPAE